MNRIIGRFVAEMVLASLWSTSRMLSDRAGKAARADRAVIFLAILQHSLLDDPTAPATGVSVHALAMSFDRPFESMRRQVNALLKDGWCVRVPSGIAVDRAKLAGPELRALRNRLHDLIVWLAEQFLTFDLRLPARRPGGSHSSETVTLAAIQLVIATIDFAAGGFGSIRQFYVVNAIASGSVRGVTFDLVLSRRFSSLAATPADQYRLGVNVARLSGVLGLPTVTVYRQVNAGVAAGMLERCSGGFRATRAHLDGDITRYNLRLATLRADRAFGRMAQDGFPFDAPSSQYIGERPVLPELAP